MSSAPFEEGFSGTDSGYDSGTEFSRHRKSDIAFSGKQLKFLNTQLAKLPPQDILRWCIATLPGLFQETALGSSGLVILDMLSKLDGPLKPDVACIFIDTLHHFDETIELLRRVKARYSDTAFHVYRPLEAATAEEFAQRHGDNLWERDPEQYDFNVKVEPSERAYTDLGVSAVLTGRRKTQGGKRGSLEVVEVDGDGLVKINPLANWSFEEVNSYINEKEVPYNELLERGYKSIGDWHSTQPVAEGEDERSGRWKGTEKTECGIHNPKSRYGAMIRAQQEREMQAALDAAFERKMEVVSST